MTTSQDTLKWKITKDETKHHDLLVKLSERSLTKAEAEKQAKAEGRWDYRNNKIVEA
jgi:TfoX/Sxy family transcriptional regulator of competence genes